MILQALDDCDSDFAEQKTAYKERRTVLENEAHKLKRDILSGQLTLVPEAAGE